MRGKKRCLFMAAFIMMVILLPVACQNKKSVKLSWAVYNYSIPKTMEKRMGF